MTEPLLLDWVTGDATGLALPAHAEAFRKGGTAWLTRAFHAFGSLPADNAVVAIDRMEPCPGGSTGQKFFLTLSYAKDGPGLQRDLFLKFSRDFTDERRDWQRTEMEGEARLVAISRLPGFPIRVPLGWFADYQAESGTGVVITERVPYGEQGIEPHRLKAMDHLTMADPLPCYQAIVTALARLAAAHKSGRLGAGITERFPWDPVAGSADPIVQTDAELTAQLEQCFAFARDCPQLLPEAVRSEQFLARMREDAFLIKRHEAAIQRFLTGDQRMIALCHWNSHIDNCWFWRDEAGELQAGLIDWGRAAQITFGSILWGGLSAAHHDIWDIHLDAVLGLFVDEYRANGGPAVTLAEVKRHLVLHMAAMGVARVLAFPEIIRFRLPECVAADGPYDPMFHAVDPARNCRQVYANFLQFWHRQDFGAVVRELVGG